MVLEKIGQEMRSFHWVLKTVAGLKTLGITIKIKGRLEFLVGN